MRLHRTLAMALPLLALLLGAAVVARPAPAEARTLGFLLSAPDGNLYLVYDGVRHGVDSPTLAALGIVETASLPVTQPTLEMIRDGSRIPPLYNGAILVGPDGARYALANGLHAILDETTFDAYGWNGYGRFAAAPWFMVDAGLLAALPLGDPLVPAARSDYNRFDWGYCTWWVAQRRAVTWNGNAIEWYANAQEQGYTVGAAPAQGAILVRRSATWGGYGHVAYVESVSGTSFTVSEMNVAGVGQLSTRTYDIVSDPPPGMVGFIYWRYGEASAAPPAVRPFDHAAIEKNVEP